MLCRVFIALAVLACIQARPQQQNNAAGQSASTITKGETFGPGGLTTITNQKVGTQGLTSGFGTNFGQAFGATSNTRGPLGTSSGGQTSAVSNQNTFPNFSPIGHPGGSFPSLPRFPSTAAGSANSEFTGAETVGPDGSTSKITNLGSSAGGEASNGGQSSSSSFGKFSSTDGIFGSTSGTELGAQSTQLGR